MGFEYFSFTAQPEAPAWLKAGASGWAVNIYILAGPLTKL